MMRQWQRFKRWIDYTINKPRYNVLPMRPGYEAYKDKHPVKQASAAPLIGCLGMLLCSGVFFGVWGGYSWASSQFVAAAPSVAAPEITADVSAELTAESTEEIILPSSTPSPTITPSATHRIVEVTEELQPSATPSATETATATISSTPTTDYTATAYWFSLSPTFTLTPSSTPTAPVVQRMTRIPYGVLGAYRPDVQMPAYLTPNNYPLSTPSFSIYATQTCISGNCGP